MIETEKELLKRNAICASIGQQLVLDVLEKYREQFISQMKTVTPTASDPMGVNLHRALGRIDAIDFLISEGRRANKQSN